MPPSEKRMPSILFVSAPASHPSALQRLSLGERISITTPLVGEGMPNDRNFIIKENQVCTEATFFPEKGETSPVASHFPFSNLINFNFSHSAAVSRKTTQGNLILQESRAASTIKERLSSRPLTSPILSILFISSSQGMELLQTTLNRIEKQYSSKLCTSASHFRNTEHTC